MEVVKIFVSSLFKEMLLERDILHRQVSAMLAQQFKGRDVSIRFVDLRWGINDSEIFDAQKRSKFVIQKCLDAIDDSDLFLGLVSSDYGSLADSAMSKEFLGEDKEFSYTEIEIRYAEKVFDKDKIVFMLTPNSDADDKRTRRLKDIIRSSYRYEEYTKICVEGKASLSPSFITGVCRLLQNSAKFDVKHFRSQEYYITHDFDRLNAMAKSNTVIVAIGEKGSGKSTALKLLAEEYKRSGCTILVNNYCGNSSLMQFLRQYVTEQDSFDKAIAAFKKYLASGDTKYIFFDSIEEIPTTQFFRFYRTINEVGQEKVRLFVSVNSEKMINYVADLEIGQVHFNGLDDDEIAPFMMHVAKQYNKMLYDDVSEYVKQHVKNAHIPLYLSILTSRLVIMGDEEYSNVYHGGKEFTNLIIKEMKKIVDSAPERLEDIILWHLRDLDRYIYPAFASFMFELMVMYGAPVPLIVAHNVYEDLFHKPWSDMDYFTYKYYLKDFISDNNNCISFQYSLVSKCVTDICAKQDVLRYSDAVYKVLVRIEIDPFTRNRLAYIADKQYFVELLEKYHDDELALEAVLAVFERAMESHQKACEFCLFLISSLNKLSYETIDFWITTMLNRASTIESKALVLEFFEVLFGEINNTHQEPKKCLLLAPLFKFAVAFGLEQNAIQLLKSWFKIISTGDVQEVICNNADKVADLFFYASKVADSIDQKELARTLLLQAIDITTKEGVLRKWIPDAARKLAQGAGSMAILLLKRLIDEYEGIEGEFEYTYAELLHIYVSLNFYKRDLDVAVPAAKRSYEAFKHLYDKDSTSIENIYGYTLGLSDWRLYNIDEPNPHEKDLRLCKEIYLMRNHVAKLAPDEYDYIRSFVIIVMEIICGDRNVGISEIEMVESLFKKLTRFAERGNPRAGWLYIDVYSKFVKKREIAEYLIAKFDKIDQYLNSIIKLNRGNQKYLKEIVSSFLQIYKTYADERILPLDQGEIILSKIISVAENIVELSPSRENYLLYFNVISELFTILLQKDPVLFGQDKRFEQFKTFAEREYATRPSAGSKLLHCMIEGLQILPIAYHMSQMQNMGGQQLVMLMMMMQELNLNQDQMLYDITNNVVTVLEEVYKETGMLEDDYVFVAQVGAATLQNFALDAEWQQRGMDLLQRINKLSK